MRGAVQRGQIANRGGHEQGGYFTQGTGGEQTRSYMPEDGIQASTLYLSRQLSRDALLGGKVKERASKRVAASLHRRVSNGKPHFPTCRGR